MSRLQLGKKVPNFKALSSEGDDFNLGDYKGQFIVLYFYPKDNTPGCTVQAEDFSTMKSKFSKQNALVVGVSRDSISSHEKFIEKRNLKISLLSDPEEKLCKLFDVIQEKNMYGRKVLGIERSTFIIGPDQKLLREWRKVKAKGHAEEVLEALKELNKSLAS